MPQTHEQVIANAAALLNDVTQRKYTSGVVLPYYNMARTDLQEIFQLNNVPVTAETSAIIEVDAGESVVPFAPDPPIVGDPYLPDDLIEIQEVFVSNRDQEDWIPVTRKDYLTQDIVPAGSALNTFGVWAWMKQEIRLLPANTDLDLKVDYICDIFVVLELADLTDNQNILLCDSFLQYRTAGLCAQYIMRSDSRASALNGDAARALEVSVGISTKGKQSIVYRRRPFRAAWKRRGILV